MVTEARSGFTAFNEGPKDDREVDFVLLRQKLAAGQSWIGSLHDEIHAGAGHHELTAPSQSWLERDGALLRLRLARPKANIIDAAMIGALQAALDAHRGSRRPARRAARRRRPAFQLRRQRRGAPARTLRGDARVAACADPRDGRIPGADPRRRARPVPGRRPGDRAGRRADLRFGRCAVRPARDQAGRLRAGGELPAGLARVGQVAAEDLLCRAAASTPQRRAGDGPGADRWPTTPRPPRWPGSTSTWRRAEQRGPGLAVRRRAPRTARVRQRSPRSSACTSRPDEDPRRQRRP